MKLLRPRRRGFLTLLFLPFSVAGPALADSATTASPGRPQLVSVATTNWTPRFVTNRIEVSMPNNVFVDEYRTNWFDQRVTNVTDAFKTNVITQTRTNVVVVEKTQTNEVTAYETRPVLAYRTNWI